MAKCNTLSYCRSLFQPLSMSRAVIAALLLRTLLTLVHLWTRVQPNTSHTDCITKQHINRSCYQEKELRPSNEITHPVCLCV